MPLHTAGSRRPAKRNAMNRLPSQTILLCAALMGYMPVASAYLDPGTGSMIVSAIVGLFATAVLAIKTYWYKIKRMLTGKRPPRQSRDDEEKSKNRPGEESH